MPQFHFRRITDPVHGTFGVSKLESDIMSTAVFQRLHNVKQLGLWSTLERATQDFHTRWARATWLAE